MNTIGDLTACRRDRATRAFQFDSTAAVAALTSQAVSDFHHGAPQPDESLQHEGTETTLYSHVAKVSGRFHLF